MMSGCTTLDSYKLNADSAVVPAGAFPYALPKTQLTTTFTLALTSCDAVRDQATGLTHPAVHLKVAAATTQIFEADEAERYYVDYKQLSGFFKTTTFKITTGSDLTLLSLNAEHSDQTLQVAGAFLQSAVQIGAAATIGPAFASFTAALHDYHADFAAKYVSKKYDLVKVVSSACNSETTAALKKLASAKVELKKALANSKTANDPAVTQATSDVADASSSLTAIIPITKEPTLADLAGGDIVKFNAAILDYVKGKWLNPNLSLGNVLVAYNGGDPVPGDQGITIRIDVPKWSHAANGGAAIPAGKIDGIVIRQPAVGFVRVCIDACSNLDGNGLSKLDSESVSLDLAPPTKIVLPQLGSKLILPLHNQLGTDATLGVTLATDGSINALSFQNTTNAAAGLSAIGGAATAYSGAVTAQNTASTAQNNAAVAAAQYADTVLKAQADCLTQVDAIIKAGGSPAISCH
jgi:hypothetical protein